MARLFVVPRLFVVYERAGDARRATPRPSELPPGSGPTAITRKQDKSRYFTAKNQPPLPAA
jgi:hypothetical protein